MCGLQLGACKLALNKRLTCVSLPCSQRQAEVAVQAGGQEGRQAGSLVGSKKDTQRWLFLPVEVSQGDRRELECLRLPALVRASRHVASLELTRTGLQEAQTDAEDLSISPTSETRRSKTCPANSLVGQAVSIHGNKEMRAGKYWQIVACGNKCRSTIKHKIEI